MLNSHCVSAFIQQTTKAAQSLKNLKKESREIPPQQSKMSRKKMVHSKARWCSSPAKKKSYTETTENNNNISSSSYYNNKRSIKVYF